VVARPIRNKKGRVQFLVGRRPGQLPLHEGDLLARNGRDAAGAAASFRFHQSPWTAVGKDGWGNGLGRQMMPAIYRSSGEGGRGIVC